MPGMTDTPAPPPTAPAQVAAVPSSPNASVAQPVVPPAPQALVPPAPQALVPPAPKPLVFKPLPPEIGGPTGPEPTRYGDWERKGRVSDF